MNNKETLEFLAYVSAFVKGLEDAKEDDGRIDKGEVLAVALATIPAAVKAGMGSWNIPAEIKKMSGAEKQKALEVCIPILTRIPGIFRAAK